MISFPHNNLCVQRTVTTSPEMPVKLRNQLHAHDLLYDVSYRGGELEAPHLRISKSKITRDELVLLQPNLTLTEDHVTLSISDDDIFGVGTFVWKRLRTEITEIKEAFEEYTTRMRMAADRPYVFEIDFDHHVDLDEFLECALNYIITDESLRADWEGCAAEIAIGYNRVESLTQIQTASATTEIVYNDSLNLSPLADVINNLVRKPKNTLLEKITWFEEGHRGGFHDRDRVSDSLVWLIIKHERNIYSRHSSFPLTKKLIDISSTSPKLINLLFTHVHDAAYLCFLLSHRPTNHIGLIGLYKNISRVGRPISDKVAYERIWQDLVWSQGLEIYCLAYEDHFEYTDIHSAIDSICEMVAWFADHEITRSSRTQVIADTRLASLRNAITSIRYLAPHGDKHNLIENHLPLLAVIIEQRATLNRKAFEPIPLGEWIIAFWAIELTQTNQNLESNEALKKLCEVLISSYLNTLKERLDGRWYGGDDPLAVDELPWGQLHECLTKGQRAKWIFALETCDDREKNLSAERSSNLNSAVRLHLRVLLQLFTVARDSQTRNDISSELISLTRRFGFAHDHYSGALNYSNDNSDYSPIRLWPTFCEAVNEFNDDQFYDLLTVLAPAITPLSALFTLLEKTIPEQRKEQIESIIKGRDIEQESPNWIPEIFEIVLKAANNGHIDIAKHFLNSIRNSAHKTHKNKIEELTDKVELKSIFDNAEPDIKEKRELIRNFKTANDSKEVVRSVNEFKNYLIASLNITIDSDTSIRQFAQLVKAAPTLQHATGLIKSALSAPASPESSKQLRGHFKTWASIFKMSGPDLKKSELPDEELRSILQLCLKTTHLNEFGEFWGMATTRQRNSYQFAAERAEYLSRSGRRHEALSYIQTLRSDETVLPPFAIDELSSIESSLLSQQTNYLPQLTSSQGPTINSVQTDLRTSWLRIRALNANDQSQILMEPNNSIDTYLLQIIEQVGNELLLRNGNLLRKKADAGSSVIPLDDEDMINDWLVSLIKQRMNFVGWTVHDQSRMGWSASGQQVGETDGWIQDGNGNLVSVIEAFRLGDKIDRTVIKKHLDKVCGYNSTGTSPIFIVIYTASDDFPKLCSEYEKYVRNLEYKGFEIGRPRNLRRKIMHMPKATAWYYEEIRYVNDTAINVYHQLLNLKPPSQAI
ncbi:hypothetical protein [Pseudomonas syringae]|uniref:hypothetical protein n=1 Tax=Pseudomonas syringae TaxID=317 RepID=UPI001E50BE8C|nr:hypothetical protein [Pseudomonas syringae]